MRRSRKRPGSRSPWSSRSQPTLAIIEKLVDGPEFQAAQKKASQAGRDPGPV